MPIQYFEDLEPGTVLDFGAMTIDKDEVIAFAKEFDPQVFHLDEEKAKATMLAGLSASGWHTTALMMSMCYDAFIKNSSSQGAPGVDEVRWMKPVRPGDVLSGRRHILAKRVSQSRPEIGFVTMQIDTLNQRGELVMMQKFSSMLGLRSFKHNDAAPQRTPKTPPLPAHLSNPHEKFDPPMSNFFEDLVVGRRLDLGTYEFTRENVLRFARNYDPQPFHLDDDAAAKSHFGRLAASGWQTSAAWMGQLVKAKHRIEREILERGGTIAQGGPSPGFTNLRWNQPVYPGDVITYAATPIDKRDTSKPGWGLVTHHNTGVNQHGVLVYEFTGTAFVQKKP